MTLKAFHILTERLRVVLFPRGAEGAFDPRALLSLRNIVVALGVLTLLIFIGTVASPRIAFLFFALMLFAGVIMVDMASRRKWEQATAERMARLQTEYDRMLREVARGRNDVAQLKKALAETGSAVVKSIPAKDDMTPEQRMLRAIAARLARVNDMPREEQPQTAAAETANTVALTPETMTDDQVLNAVRSAVKLDNIDLFMQPVVNLPQRKVRFFETFSRIRLRAGVYLEAGRYITAAIKNDMAPVIDNLLLLRTLQYLRDTEKENAGRAFFCNITSLTLNDPKFMTDLVEFIAQNRTLAPQLVFELAQQDLATMSPDVFPVLDGLTQLGCRFSMDNVRALSFDFEHLAARRIRFVKLEAARLLDEMNMIGGVSRLKRMKSELDRAGIDVIVERIETEKQLRELLDIDVDYGQGFLFGRPDAIHEDKAA